MNEKNLQNETSILCMFLCSKSIFDVRFSMEVTTMVGATITLSAMVETKANLVAITQAITTQNIMTSYSKFCSVAFLVIVKFIGIGVLTSDLY